MRELPTFGHQEHKPPMRAEVHSLSEFLEQVRGFMRMRRLSRRTENSYLIYIERFIRFHRRRPETMGVPEIEAYLTHMALHQGVAAATQHLAFCWASKTIIRAASVNLCHIETPFWWFRFQLH